LSRRPVRSGGGSLWLASGSIDRSEFNTFAGSLDLGDRDRGLQGIRWGTPATGDQVAAFVARNRADGEPGFTITPPAGGPCTT
jgi:CHASE domain-containing protein